MRVIQPWDLFMLIETHALSEVFISFSSMTFTNHTSNGLLDDLKCQCKKKQKMKKRRLCMLSRAHFAKDLFEMLLFAFRRIRSKCQIDTVFKEQIYFPLFLISGCSIIN